MTWPPTQMEFQSLALENYAQMASYGSFLFAGLNVIAATTLKFFCRKFGKPCMTGGIVLMAVGLFLLAACKSVSRVWLIFAATAVIGFGIFKSASFVFLSIPLEKGATSRGFSYFNALIANWFLRKKGWEMGIITAGMMAAFFTSVLFITVYSPKIGFTNVCYILIFIVTKGGITAFVPYMLKRGYSQVDAVGLMSLTNLFSLVGSFVIGVLDTKKASLIRNLCYLLIGASASLSGTYARVYLFWGVISAFSFVLLALSNFKYRPAPRA